MAVEAILYTSQTGTTAAYAAMLGEATGLPVYTFAEAEEALPWQTEVVYLGWLMAGKIKEAKQADRAYRLAAVGAVGLNATADQLAESRRVHEFPKTLPMFALPGGYFPDKLRGLQKFLMGIITRAIEKKIRQNPDKTEAEKELMRVLTRGGSLVDAKHLADLTAWVNAHKEDVP